MSEEETADPNGTDQYEVDATAAHDSSVGTEADAGGGTAVLAPPEPLFEKDELAQFDEDDITAGRAICKMLSLFFLYTMFAMALVGLWTYGSVFWD